MRPTLDISFAPAWWYHHYGMTFGERDWLDPIARTERDREQRRLLFERFGDVGLGERDPQPRPNIEAYGHRFMAAVWGCDIVYQKDQAPSAMVLPRASERMRDLRAPDFDDSPIIQRAWAEAGLLSQRYGHCDGSVNLGGPLNNAVSVLGEAILEACVAEPDLARDALHRMAETIVWVDEHVTNRISAKATPTPRPAIGIGNCPVCLVSPHTYAGVVRPVDVWLRDQYVELNLHHCGVFHPYAGVYQALRPTHLDVGWGTDLRATRCAYPHTPMSLEVQVKALSELSRAGIDTLLATMIEQAGPLELITLIWVAEAGPDLPDQAVRDYMTAADRLGR